MSTRLIQILASLAKRNALRGLDVICETQHQISTRKLDKYLEQVGDELASNAHYLRIEYDALTSKVAALEAELAKLRAGQEPVDTVPKWRHDALIQHAKHQDKVIAKLRDEKKYDSLDALKAAIGKDCDDVRAWFATHPEYLSLREQNG